MGLIDRFKKNKLTTADNNEIEEKPLYSIIKIEYSPNTKVKSNLKVAYQYGEKLQSFKNKQEAEEYFYAYRTCLSNKLKSICKNHSCFLPDYTVESLKVLEKWYFDLYENNSFDILGVDQHEFEDMMSIYFGDVVINNNSDAKWTVVEYPFTQEKYELMINKNLFSMTIKKCCRDWYKEPSNKRHNLLFRTYNRYFKS